jgi:hypothetical protein
MKQQPFTVIPFRARTIGTQKKGFTLPPRYDLQPMTHHEACTFAKNCTNEETGYMIHPWPAAIPFPPLRPICPHRFNKSIS